LIFNLLAIFLPSKSDGLDPSTPRPEGEKLTAAARRVQGTTIRRRAPSRKTFACQRPAPGQTHGRAFLIVARLHAPCGLVRDQARLGRSLGRLVSPAGVAARMACSGAWSSGLRIPIDAPACRRQVQID
jgi:hypothetical protein